jgi:competence protein ComEC
VLKVGHHGSNYGSTPAFLAAVAPTLGLISVGRHNTFGHPGTATLARLASNAATVLRIDRCGAIIIYAELRSVTMFPCTRASR